MICLIIIKKNKKIPTSIMVSKADTFRKRLAGLMFNQVSLQHESLHLMPCNSIHMFFMRFPIDVLFLDKNSQVVKKVENLQPWAFIPPVKNAYSTMECPVGTISNYGIEVGDRLSL